MQRLEKIEKWIVYIVAILLCLVLASFWMMCNLYARYTTEASGEDGARVAKFEVTEVADEQKDITKQINISLVPGESDEYIITVTNKSEVAIRYSIEATDTTQNLPITFQMMKVEKANGGEENSNSADTNGIISESVIASDDIPAGDVAERTYKLKISWPIEQSEQKDYNYAGKVDTFEVKLRAEQID